MRWAGLAVLLTSGLVHAQTRTPWQMHDGLEVTKKNPNGFVQFSCNPRSQHGNICEYNSATVPTQNDSGWRAAPDPDIINFSIPSRVCNAKSTCWDYGDFTYFQTLVTVPQNTRITTFTITFNGMDDGSRVSIYNSRYPNGLIITGSYVYLGGSGTTNLGAYVQPGEVNRVVVTQVDDCCRENNLREARVVLNGEPVVVGTPPPPQPVAVERARSSPIVLTDGTTFQGTYLDSTTPQATYPPVLGHFRQYPPGALNGATTQDFAAITSNWDAADRIPAAAQRTLYTAVPVGSGYQQLSFDRNNLVALASPLGVSQAQAGTLIDSVRTGRLGGVDRSTGAVVGPSTIAGQSNRATVAYFGALDGMLHAVFVSGTESIQPGTELWGFIPPSQLGRISASQAGVDGSPAVADAFISDASGNRSWRTLLAITCAGFGGTVTVLDVTDPMSPVFLWEGAATDGGYSMGAARSASFGQISIQERPASVIYLATNNQGNAGAGMNLYALDAGTGAVLSRFSRTYNRRIYGTNTPIPNDVPGIPAVASTTGDGSFDNRVFIGDLDGRLWQLDAAFDNATVPTQPIFDTGVDGQPLANPIAAYRDSSTRHLIVTGVTGGADWVPTSVTPYAFAVDTQVAVAEPQPNSGTNRIVFQVQLSSGDRSYAPPTVAGSDVYIYTSSSALSGTINANTGTVRRISLLTGQVTATSVVTAGAGEVSLTSDGRAVVTSATGISQLDNTGRNANGLALNDLPLKLLNVDVWLDLH